MYMQQRFQVRKNTENRKKSSYSVHAATFPSKKNKQKAENRKKSQRKGTLLPS